MLILSRKIGESIVIQVGNRKIKLIMVEQDNGSIKIGFEAPKDIKIYREEVYEEIVKQNKASLESDVNGLGKIKTSIPKLVKKDKKQNT
ncbi:carbon storage regulator [Petrotoga sp. 9T1HF07.CasAA.8.2]|uniref:carbon storage regulator n=1 Tax=Petrotoga sp. 9T1HF07.CasAA.8.2 TaxID=1434329 RepID=UPI000CB322E5|nr:carbon storage regulator [Petrotoga sp. 9T1HF07.CasAA.8.2]PNR87037.1 carbon storage regulator [Petrotoga sp. 9T1HF07.CasAA.8.2]